MCGLDPLDEGSVELDGRVLPRGSYAEVMKHGLHYLSEDRKTLEVKRTIVAKEGENGYKVVHITD